MSTAAPAIEGSLKNTIHAFGFGLIVTTLTVNFGKLFLPHFFPFVMAIVIFFEMVLFSLDRPKEVYEKFQTPGIKGSHTIGGDGSPQITVSAPDDDYDSTPKKQGGRIKDKLKTKKEQKGGRRESAALGSPTKQGLTPPSPHTAAGTDTKGRDKEADEKGKEKSDKEKKKEEEKERKREKEEEKERQKAEKKEEKETEDDKGEKGSWRKRLHKSNKQNE